MVEGEWNRVNFQGGGEKATKSIGPFLALHFTGKQQRVH
jgi:hypothetical protein